MPSEDFNRLGDADLADLVAYLRTLPPKAGTPAARQARERSSSRP